MNISYSPFYSVLQETRIIQKYFSGLTIRPKAIRDKIPQMIDKKSLKSVVKYTDKDFLPYMEMKVMEEFGEYIQNRSVKEFCDLLDVLERIQELNEWSDEEIASIRTDKERRKGKFRKNLVLNK